MSGRSVLVFIVWFQGISTPPPLSPWRVVGNSVGEGGSLKPNFIKESVKLNMDFQRVAGGERGQTKKTSL